MYFPEIGKSIRFELYRQIVPSNITNYNEFEKIGLFNIFIYSV